MRETKDTFAILFYLKTSKKNQKKDEPNVELPIYCRVSVCGTDQPFSCKLKINPAFWNQKAKRAIGTSPKISKINKQLAYLETELWDLYDEIKKRRNMFTAKYLVDRFFGRVDDKNNVTLLDYFDKYNKRLYKRVELKTLTKETYDRYTRAREHLQKFMQAEKQRDDFYLDEIDVEFAEDYYMYILKTTESKNNNAQKYVQKLRTIVTDAWSNAYIQNDPLVHYDMHFDEFERPVLIPEEIYAIMGKKFQTKRLEKARDMYVFAIFTGYAYKEVNSLQDEDIAQLYDGNTWITKNRAKTNTEERVPLFKIPELIIEKYRHERKGSKVFELISNQKMNEYLKEIAALCGIEKNLTFHTARHTFATTIALNNDIPIEVVSKLLGHKNISTTQIYAKILNKTVSNKMQDLSEKICNMEGLYNLTNQ